VFKQFIGTYNPIVRNIENKETMSVTKLFGGLFKQSIADAKEEASGASLDYSTQHFLSLNFNEIEHRGLIHYPSVLIVGGFDKGEFEVKWILIYEGTYRALEGKLLLKIID